MECMKKSMKSACITALICLFFVFSGKSQLVTKKDYDAAFALQGGIETGILLPASSPHIRINPAAGLKMTFPFTRKWFLGSEINYSRLQADIRLKETATREKFTLERLLIPLYIKYTLPANRSSVLLGIYGGWIYKREEAVRPWEGGIVAGYEQRIVKHVHLTFKLSGSIKEAVSLRLPEYKKYYPLQASLTLSYDVLRIGDCGCD